MAWTMEIIMETCDDDVIPQKMMKMMNDEEVEMRNARIILRTDVVPVPVPDTYSLHSRRSFVPEARIARCEINQRVLSCGKSPLRM
jgi:hypothetical protein